MPTPDSEKFPTDPTELETFPKRSAHLSGWPEPVHDALDSLVYDATEAGTKTTRSELVAAVIFYAYRHKTTGEISAILEQYKDAKVVYTEPDD